MEQSASSRNKRLLSILDKLAIATTAVLRDHIYVHSGVATALAQNYHAVSSFCHGAQ